MERLIPRAIAPGDVGGQVLTTTVDGIAAWDDLPLPVTEEFSATADGFPSFNLTQVPVEGTVEVWWCSLYQGPPDPTNYTVVGQTLAFVDDTSMGAKVGDVISVRYASDATTAATWDPSTMLGADLVHPNDAGMTYLADTYVAALAAAGRMPAPGAAIAAYGDSWTASDIHNTPGQRAIQRLVDRLDLGTLTNYASNGYDVGDGAVTAIGSRGVFPAGASGLVLVNLGLNDLLSADTAQQRAVIENYLRSLLAVLCAAERIEQESFTFGPGWTLNGPAVADFSGGSNRSCTAEGATATYTVTTPGTYYLLVNGLDGTSSHRGGILTISQGGTTLATVDQDGAALPTGNLLTSFYGPLAVRLDGVVAGTLTVTHSQAGRGSGAASFLDALVRIAPSPLTVLAVKPVEVLSTAVQAKLPLLGYVRDLYDTLAAEFGANVVVCDPDPGWTP